MARKTISLKWEPETYSEGMVMIYAFLKYSRFVTMEAIFFTFWYMLHIVVLALNACSIKSIIYNALSIDILYKAT